MTAQPHLTSELRAQVSLLEDDLRDRVNSDESLLAKWKQEHADALSAERTSASWEAWVDERVTLAAVSWVLVTVFIRFCEDNSLLSPVWIAGPRAAEALDAQQHFIQETARATGDATDREWLEHAIDHLARLQSTRDLVDANAPLWSVSLSGDAATRLLDFWRERDENGAFVRDLTDAELDTRFLGDIYQDISDDARARYALLQTPEFVEEFILDRTMEPALDDRPLEGFRIIDPTCGSGHFLLGAFRRLLDRWHAAAPGMDERERVQLALDAIHGVDINPYAVAISRFRLTVTALRACGMSSLEEAPAFKYHLAAGDSLLHGGDADAFALDLGAVHSPDRVAATHAYATENLAALQTLLANGRYDCVVGNPPYISVKDAKLRDVYRARYSTCKGKYVLTIPFMEKFFSLARTGDRPGWVGQITSNSFMKREFGSKLIEEYLPQKDLRLIVDTSGAYIPGHGTPTVIIVGRPVIPTTRTVRAVLGVRGEPGRPDDPAQAKVWSSIVAHLDVPGHEDDWISVADLERTRLGTHPWSLSGGGAVEALTLVNSQSEVLVASIESIGFAAITGDDEVFVPGHRAPQSWDEHRIPMRTFVEGDRVRDFNVTSPSIAAFPHGHEVGGDADYASAFWPYRTRLRNGLAFGRTREDMGKDWWEYILPNAVRLDAARLITFAFVATHNHFVLDRGGRVFNRSAPVIKLPSDATEDDHLALLGVLNSSTACFWLKQNSHDKGNGGIGGGIADQEWERFYEFTGTTLKDFPLPGTLPLLRGSSLDHLAQQLSATMPEAVVASALPTRESLDTARVESTALLAAMIAQQEELDWECYRLYGLIADDLTYSGEVPALELGQRAFEIALARGVASGEEETAWFERHRSTPIVDLPAHWPDDYRKLVERRLAVMSEDRSIRLLEKPENKRRWAAEPWEKLEERALRSWLLDRLEARSFWLDAQRRPVAKSVAVLADSVARDEELVSVLGVWEGRPGIPVVDSLAKLLSGEAVPYLAALRYKDSGLRKRAAWERTWELQRREDAGTYNPALPAHGGDGPIPVPPNYITADFRRSEFWSHRGKLDVPKERFILYPDAGRGGDTSAVLGWAGWNHAEQALALAQLTTIAHEEAWDESRIVPLVAGLAELMPWLGQWHSEPEDLYGGPPSDFFAGILAEELSALRITRNDLGSWRPAPTTRGRKARS